MLHRRNCGYVFAQLTILTKMFKWGEAIERLRARFDVSKSTREALQAVQHWIHALPEDEQSKAHQMLSGHNFAADDDTTLALMLNFMQMQNTSNMVVLRAFTRHHIHFYNLSICHAGKCALAKNDAQSLKLQYETTFGMLMTTLGIMDQPKAHLDIGDDGDYWDISLLCAVEPDETPSFARS